MILAFVETRFAPYQNKVALVIPFQRLRFFEINSCGLGRSCFMQIKYLSA